MLANLSLLNRVSISLAFFGAAVSISLAILIYFFSLYMEDSLIDETLSAELEDYISRRQRNPQSLPERTATIRAYVINNENETHIPEAISKLLPGQHTLQLDGIKYRVGVQKVENQRFIVLYDTSSSQQREYQLLILLSVSVVLVTLISAIVGRRLATRIISPVTELVKEVAELNPEEEHIPLAEHFPWVEIRELAADFDIYIARLHDFIERERLFTGDVSHELRTPLAILDGAANLILNDKSIDKKLHKRVSRIARASVDMSRIVAALLALAREKGDVYQRTIHCDCRTVIEEEINRYKAIFHHKSLDVQLEITAIPDLAIDQAILSMVFGNLLRNAFSYTEEGSITIIIDESSLCVEDTGSGLDPKSIEKLTRPYVRSPDSTGSGLGLSLVWRLCERYGWTLILENRQQGGTSAKIVFKMPTEQPGQSD